MNAMFQRMLLILTGACLILAASAGWVCAQSYPAGTFNVEPRVGLFGSSNPRVNTIWTYGAAAGVFVADNVALELESMGAYIDQSRPLRTPGFNDEVSRKTSAFASNLNLRWHMLTTTQASMYLGAGMGGIWANYNLPYNGFEDSITENCELGATLALTSHMSFKGAFRYWHIGQFTDQGVNAYGGTVGLNFSF
jgi:hypothetical protein